MPINTVTRNASTANLLRMRAQLEDLQRQLGTNQKAETYGGLGADRSVSISFRSKVSSLDSYSETANLLSLRFKLLDSTLTRLAKVPTDIRATLDPNAYEVRLDGRTDAQKSARIALDEVVGLLNAEADGRFLFSGKATDTKPVVNVDTMLNGDGAKDGLKQVIAERLTADLGSGGRGRLDLSTAGTTVSIARQSPLSSEFGFKIADAETTSAAVSLTETGSPITQVDVDFTAQPSAGDTITLDLTNPDGTTSRVTLTATLSDSPAAGQFTIGATAGDTAANFQTALGTSLDRTVATDLRAASASRAAETFFDTFGGAAPQRVDAASGGGTLATATDLKDGTTDDTVFWYKGYNAAVDPGDPSTLPRNDAVARVDTSIDVAYGARANEDGLRLMVQALALTSVETFSGSVETDEDRYRALMERTRETLAFDGSAQEPADIHAEIAVGGNIATQALARHKVSKSAMLEMLDGVEGVKMEDVAAQILTLQTRLQASYQTTAILSQLSLVNYV
jgi:flagellar hook-associated protein 3 FlgL